MLKIQLPYYIAQVYARNFTLYWSMTLCDSVCVTCSVLREIRFPIVLLKKDASKGLSGDGCSRKAYRVSSKGSSLPNLSLIIPTSHVNSSQAMFAYLWKMNIQVHQCYAKWKRHSKHIFILTQYNESLKDLIGLLHRLWSDVYTSSIKHFTN